MDTRATYLVHVKKTTYRRHYPHGHSKVVAKRNAKAKADRHKRAAKLKQKRARK